MSSGPRPHRQTNARSVVPHELFPRQLVDQALDGDADAEQRLWRNVLTTVQSLAQALCRRQHVPPDDIEDVVQDTVLDICRQSPQKLAAIRNWPCWLYRVVANHVVSHIRRRARHDRENISLDGGHDDEAATLAAVLSGGDDPAAHAEHSELASRAYRWLEGLPKERAAVFRLYLQGLTQREIAERTGRPINTVGIWIYRTKKHLRSDLRG